MKLRLQIASLLAGLACSTAACTLAFTYLTLEDTLDWRPAPVAAYDFDAVQQETVKPFVRVIGEEASKIVERGLHGPVTSAVIMDEGLRAYRDLYQGLGPDAALSGAMEVLALWDPEEMEILASSFPEDLRNWVLTARDRHGADPLYQDVVDRARAARDFARTAPERPTGDNHWAPLLGAVDTDGSGGSMPFSSALISMPEVPPALDIESRAGALDIRFVDVATRIATPDQRRNSVFWQGSGSFTKGLNATGITPSDVWQIIFFKEAAHRLTEEDYVEISAGLAAVTRDAAVAAWRIKYRDWSLRPSMRIPKIEAAIGNPSFPGYVSGHATLAAASARYLTERDPAGAATWARLARDSEKSRFFGGVHTPSDNIMGIWLGRAIADQHLGRKDGPSAPEIFPRPARMELALDLFEGALDAVDAVEDRITRALSPDGLTFRLAETALPVPRAKPGQIEGNDTMKGSIAAADLDGDGLPELLMGGYRSIRLYRNLGGLDFELIQEIETPELNGAYFSRNADGEVDGIWAFGTTDPVWFLREEAMRFSADPLAVEGWPDTDEQNYKGMVLHDVDGDGDEDAIFLNYEEIAVRDGFVSYAGTGWENRVAIREEDHFRFGGVRPGATGRSFAGGWWDLDGDGVAEEIVAHDGLPIEVVGRDWPRDERVSGAVGGMSFTPIRVGDRDAIHISNVFEGETDLYSEQEDPSFADRETDGDILIAMSKDGVLEDISEGRLQMGPLEWSWGSQAGDINGDGLEDLVIVHGYTPNLVYGCGLRILLQQEDGTFRPATTQIKIGSFYPKGLLMRDLDGDGDLDLLLSSWRRIQLWENTSQVKPGIDFFPSRPAITGFLTQSIR